MFEFIYPIILNIFFISVLQPTSLLISTSKLVLAASASCLLLTLIVGFIAFPSIFRAMVEKQISLQEGNQIRKYYLKVPVPLRFNVYFFNVTNPGEVQQGEKPVLKEIGPYCYDSYIEKVDVTDNEEEDSLTYSPRSTFFFNATRSGKLSQDDYVTILNPLTVGMVNAVLRISPVLMATVAKAFNHLFVDIQSIYTTVRVRDILFDGIPINCNVSDFAAKAVCSQIRINAASLGLRETEKNVYMFSVMGPKNGTSSKRVKVLRGIKSSKDLGRMVELNGEKELTLWGSDECNKFQGTDGWIFPPFLTKEDGIWSFAQDLCRNVHLEYKEDVEYKGLAVRRHEGTLGDQSSNEEDKCYCSKPTDCLPKGVFDMYKCLGAPMMATLPHFYETDEIYLKQVEGLKPNKSKHALDVVVEPNLGMPVKAYQRIQLNLFLTPREDIPFMTTIPKVLHPIFWLEQGIIVEGDLLKEITSVFTLLNTASIVKFIFIFISLIGLCFGGYLFYKEKNSSSKVAISTPYKSNTFDLGTNHSDNRQNDKNVISN